MSLSSVTHAEWLAFAQHEAENAAVLFAVALFKLRILESPAQSKVFLEEAARLEYAPAMTLMAACFASGAFGAQYPLNAYLWAQKAADQGDVRSVLGAYIDIYG